VLGVSNQIDHLKIAPDRGIHRSEMCKEFTVDRIQARVVGSFRTRWVSSRCEKLVAGNRQPHLILRSSTSIRRSRSESLQIGLMIDA
jgi:hypothetical protein